MTFTKEELEDMISAISEAQDELCVDLEGTQFPDGTAYWHRLDAILDRLTKELHQ